MILKKLSDEYKLYSHDSCIATTHESPYKKLSLKNCQAIENGYDLDELAYGCDLYEKMNFVGQMSAFKLGFQKALEIFGDKKYTETELYRAFLINSAGNDTTLRNFFEQTVLPMFQDNEWEVEIEMQKVKDETKIIGAVKGVKGSGNKITTYKSVPKLDADGCLILRRC